MKDTALRKEMAKKRGISTPRSITAVAFLDVENQQHAREADHDYCFFPSTCPELVLTEMLAVLAYWKHFCGVMTRRLRVLRNTTT
jgi:hypothetical protein